MNISEASKEMKSILQLEDPSMEVKLFKPSENISSNIKLIDKKSRYCQFLMRTRHGETLLLTTEEEHCYPFKPRKL